MITIISGTPGSGKTALLVDMMMEELKQGRKIFTIGIPKLLLNVNVGGDSHEWQDGTWLQIDKYAPELTKSKGIKSTWFPRGCPDSCQFLSTCPRVGSHNQDHSPDSGSLIVIDESHTDFPQRASGKTPPPYVEALTTHRHQGLDFWFVSQRPSFLDPFVRGLSSRHIHISLNPFSFGSSRNKYEWTEYQETVNRTSKLLASKSSYKPSPAVFPLYASASVHTKLDKRMPSIMKVFILSIVVIVLFVGYGVTRIINRVQPIQAAEAVSISSSTLASSSSVQAAEPSESGGERSAHALAVVSDAIKNTLPLTKVSSCISNKRMCKCYTSFGRVVHLSEQECRNSVLEVNDHFQEVRSNAPTMFASTR